MNTNTATTTASVTFTGLTPTTAKKLWDTYETLTTTTTKTRGRRGPLATTTEEEEEETDTFSASDLKKTRKRAKAIDETEEEEETEETEKDGEFEEEEDTEEEESEEEEEETVSFTQVKKEIDRYGDKKPKAMKALLASFKINSTAELKTSKKKWAPVYKKIIATFKTK